MRIHVGDYIDDADLGSISGVGSVYGLESGRHVRINYPNVKEDLSTSTWSRGVKIYGEGIYKCYNDGSCIGPDVCTCKDGYSGYGQLLVCLIKLVQREMTKSFIL